MEAVIDTIIDQARTGEIGDGKIFGMWSYKYLFICFIFVQFVYVVAEILHNTENWISWSTVWRIFLTIQFEATSCFVLVGAVSPVSDVIRIRTGTAWTSASITPSLVCLHPFLNLWLAPPSKCCSIYVFIPEKCSEPGFGCFWIRRTRVKGRENGWWASWYAGIRWWHRWCLREASQIL